MSIFLIIGSCRIRQRLGVFSIPFKYSVDVSRKFSCFQNLHQDPCKYLASYHSYNDLTRKKNHFMCMYKALISVRWGNKSVDRMWFLKNLSYILTEILIYQIQSFMHIAQERKGGKILFIITSWLVLIQFLKILYFLFTISKHFSIFPAGCSVFLWFCFVLFFSLEETT